MLGLDPRVLTNVAVLVAGNPSPPPSGNRVVYGGDPVKYLTDQVVYTPSASGFRVVRNGDPVLSGGDPIIYIPE
jgi:hypothetical protein